VSRHKYKRQLLRVLGSGTCEAVGAVSDTLLGPEGSGNTRAWPLVSGWVVVWPGFFWSWAQPSMQVCPVWGVGCRLYVENFTVDASIFVVSSF